jgi:hypothetical protein
MGPIQPTELTVTENDTREHAFIRALGTAVMHVWAELPREIQEKLFEHAVVAGHQSERDESLREQLAKYLHARHERTQAAQPS